MSTKLNVTDSFGLVHRDKDGNVVQSDKSVDKVKTRNNPTDKTNLKEESNERKI